MPSGRRAVFLDRDLLTGSVELCQRVKDAGFALVVVTNQPEVGKRRQSMSSVLTEHSRLLAELPIDRVEACFDEDESRRRKPSPGMLFDAARALDLDLGRSYMIGDGWRDIDCGKAAGCRTILIDHGDVEPLHAKPDLRARNLTEAVNRLF